MESADYLVRTRANVIDSDATVVFSFGPPTGGSLRTIEFCRLREKPYHSVDLLITNRKRAVDAIVRWLNGDPELNDYEDYDVLPPTSCTLNVAGSRESKALGIQDAVYRLMVDVLIQTNPECKSYYPLVEPRLNS